MNLGICPIAAQKSQMNMKQSNVAFGMKLVINPEELQSAVNHLYVGGKSEKNNSAIVANISSAIANMNAGKINEFFESTLNTELRSTLKRFCSRHGDDKAADLRIALTDIMKRKKIIEGDLSSLKASNLIPNYDTYEIPTQIRDFNFDFGIGDSHDVLSLSTTGESSSPVRTELRAFFDQNKIQNFVEGHTKKLADIIINKTLNPLLEEAYNVLFPIEKSL